MYAAMPKEYCILYSFIDLFKTNPVILITQMKNVTSVLTEMFYFTILFPISHFLIRCTGQ